MKPTDVIKKATSLDFRIMDARHLVSAQMIPIVEKAFKPNSINRSVTPGDKKWDHR